MSGSERQVEPFRFGQF